MDLFDDLPLATEDLHTAIGPGAVLIRGLGRAGDVQILQAVESVIAQAPLRQPHTPGGYTMSIQTTRCGSVGWLSEPGGYRYSTINPRTGQPWPAIPACLMDFAVDAATQAGYPDFVPDSCMINQYLPGNKQWVLAVLAAWWGLGQAITGFIAWGFLGMYYPICQCSSS